MHILESYTFTTPVLSFINIGSSV